LKEVSISRKSSESEIKALKIAEFISAKKAKDVVVLDIREISSLCDYFVICSGDSASQVKAISEEAVKRGKKNKIKARPYENDKSLRWVLIDFFDVILHVFDEEVRKFYNLEYLWNEAKKVSLPK